MNRDLVLATLVVALCGSAIWLTGWLPARRGGRAEESGRVAERRAWRALWLPLVPAAAALAALAGWAMQEPHLTDEILRPVTPLFVAPLAALWLRAAWRAGRALAHPRVPPLAATLGLWRPRIAVDERLSRDLDATARQAVLAHDGRTAATAIRCGSRLAQIASDLQWPSPRAAARFEAWRQALELARDERPATAASTGKIGGGPDRRCPAGPAACGLAGSAPRRRRAGARPARRSAAPAVARGTRPTLERPPGARRLAGAPDRGDDLRPRPWGSAGARAADRRQLEPGQRRDGAPTRSSRRRRS